jgi:hemoglobin
MEKFKKDISSIADIKLLVNEFYEKVNKDDLLAWIFNDLSKVDWKAHLPIMYNFWSTILLGTKAYKGQPFDVHLYLPVGKEHFDRWVKLFADTVEENFSGEIADEAKSKANSISEIFQYKIKMIKGVETNIGMYKHEEE